jgi:hypothetical protein
VNTVMNLRVPENIGKFLSSCAVGGFSRRAQQLAGIFPVILIFPCHSLLYQFSIIIYYDV